MATKNRTRSLVLPKSRITYALECETCGARSPKCGDEDAVCDIATDAGWTIEGNNEDYKTECPACQVN